jgi:hypothetical protein
MGRGRPGLPGRFQSPHSQQPRRSEAAAGAGVISRSKPIHTQHRPEQPGRIGADAQQLLQTREIDLPADGDFRTLQGRKPARKPAKACRRSILHTAGMERGAGTLCGDAPLQAGPGTSAALQGLSRDIRQPRHDLGAQRSAMQVQRLRANGTFRSAQIQSERDIKSLSPLSPTPGAVYTCDTRKRSDSGHAMPLLPAHRQPGARITGRRRRPQCAPTP